MECKRPINPLETIIAETPYCSIVSLCLTRLLRNNFQLDRIAIHPSWKRRKCLYTVGLPWHNRYLIRYCALHTLYAFLRLPRRRQVNRARVPPHVPTRRCPHEFHHTHATTFFGLLSATVTDFEIVKRKCKFHDINRDEFRAWTWVSPCSVWIIWIGVDETVEIVPKYFLIHQLPRYRSSVSNF